MILRLTGAVCTAVLLTGCSNQDLPTICTRELRITLSPMDTTLNVGQSFTPSLQLSSCGGREKLTDTFNWTPDNVLIVDVEPTTGRITARSSGEARITVEGSTYHRLSAIHVTVR